MDDATSPKGHRLACKKAKCELPSEKSFSSRERAWREGIHIEVGDVRNLLE